jgi:hypothetical protein
MTKGGIDMKLAKRFHLAGYLLAGLVGAAGGAATVVVATDRMPDLMAKTMRRMMSEMAGDGCSPAEI